MVLEHCNWPGLGRELSGHGAALIPALLSPAQCMELSQIYAQSGAFRSRVVMARHGFGRGEYQYFRYPLPALVQQLRTAIYAPLSHIANQWSVALGLQGNFPDTLKAFLDRCHDE